MPLKPPASRRFAVLALDVLVTAIVISAALAALLPEARAIVFKARFVDVLSALSFERAPLIERHAVAGAWGGTAADDKEGRGFRVTTADGSIFAAGALSGRGFAVGMRPAMADPVNHWSVLWLCGMRAAPSGWAASSAGTPFELPDASQLSVCPRETR